MENLGLHGHNVTFLTMQPPKTPIKNGVKVFYMKQVEELYESIRPNSIDMMKNEPLVVLNFITMVVVDLCESMLTSEQFRLIVKDRATHYDVVIIDNLLSECGLSIVPLLGSPTFVYFGTTTIYDGTANALDIPVPFSYVPTLALPQDTRMTFTQRLINAFLQSGYLAFRKYHIFSNADKMVQKHWPGLPRLQHVEQNVSLVLTNSHSLSLDNVRPTAPIHVEVGGMHCRPSKKLGKDLEDILGQSGSDGFIYFSMGSNIKSMDMTSEKMKMFLDAFRRLKQTLGGQLPGHPNIKLFISHGGQLSTQEAVYHGVPILGLPIGWDQIINLNSGISKGFARKLHYANLSSDDIYEQITEIMRNKSYKEKAAYYSSLFRDRPQDPLDTATYWVEFVIRHQDKTREHLRSNGAKKLNFFQYFLLDVILFILIVSALTAFIIFHIGRYIFIKLCRSTKHYQQKNKNK